MNIRKIGSSPTPTMTIPLDKLGPPGAPGVLIVVPQFEGSTGDDVAALGDTTRRLFVVSGRLSRAPLQSDDLKGDFTEEDGGTYLVCPAGELNISTNWGSCTVKKNPRGELSLVEAQCFATTPAEAAALLLQAAAPVLDHFSYAYNVPLFVVMVRVHDVTHQSTHIEFVSPARTQVVVPSALALSEAMRPVYSMYREAKNSGSPFYQFLCLYKIMEGLLLGKMRADVIEAARKRAITLAMERHLVPDDENLAPELRRHAGTVIKKFFDNVLTSRFRHAVAHFRTSDDRVLHVSSPAELKTYRDLAFASDLCVRVLVAGHERLLAQLG